MTLFQIGRAVVFSVWALSAAWEDFVFGGVDRRLSILLCSVLLAVCGAEVFFNTCIVGKWRGVTNCAAWKNVCTACASILICLIVQKISPFGTADIWFISGMALALGSFWVVAVLISCAACFCIMNLLRKHWLPFIPFLAAASLTILCSMPLAAQAGVAIDKTSNTKDIQLSNSIQKQSAIPSYEFIDQEITDILYAVSLFSGKPVVADETVNGRTSFKFSGGSEEQAFDSFLSANKLFAMEKDGVIAVSRISIIHSDDGTIQLDAYDVEPSVLFDKISVQCATTIIYDVLPVNPISVHLGNVDSFEAVKLIASQVGNCSVRKDRNIIYVSRTTQSIVSSNSNTGKIIINLEDISTESAESYQVDIENASFTAVLEKLFAEGEREFCTLFSSPPKLERALFSDRDFNGTLGFLCSLSGCSFIVADNIYCIFDENASDASVISLAKKDAIRNADKEWRLFSLKYISMDEFLPLYQARFKQMPLIELPGGSRFLCFSDISTCENLSVFIENCDVQKNDKIVSLKYITADDFLLHLPPSVQKENFTNTGRENTLFFNGTDHVYRQLLAELEYIDKPVQCIRYDLLVIQYQKTSSFSHKINFSAAPLELGSRNDLTAVLGSVLALNIDVVSVFGLRFAAELQSAISANEAKVFADTTLHGISGSSIDFQNTNTFRYRDSAVDSETGKNVNTGITREIVAGLMMTVRGWVSGDGMITTKVNASVSRRGADTSLNNGNPPPTSEKSISTEVRSRSGEPVVLSGLVQNDSTIVEERIPLISRIPLLGRLFRAESKVDESTEMVIYLVPYVVNSGEIGK